MRENMIKSKPVNLLASLFSSKMRHLSLTRGRDHILSGRSKMQNSYKIFNKLVVVFVFLILQGGSNLFAQQLEISGKVTSAIDGTPLAYANVLEKGTTNGVSTDANGEFKLNVNTGSTLVVSYIGYIKQEIVISEQKYYDIVLQPTAEELKEVQVVAIGYGTVKRTDATGSITDISAKDFEQGTITSPQELLVGKAPGVIVNTLGGAPGANTRIRIRGGASLTANNDPLIIVDGFPLSSSGIAGMSNPLSVINPNDIASITILKDASATAIYGERGSNGIILITTKKPTKAAEHKMIINYNGNFSVADPTKYMSVFTGDQFRALVQDRVNNYGLSPAALTVLGNANTDWQSQIYHTAAASEHNISIYHAIASIPYRLGLDYMYNGGILKRNYIDRKNVNLDLIPTLFDGNLTADFNVSASWIHNNFSNTDAIGAAIQYDPTQPVMNGNTRFGGYTTWTLPGDTNGINGYPINIATVNPVAALNLRNNTADAKNFLFGSTFNYQVPYITGLKATLNLGYNYYKSDGVDILDTLAGWSYRTPETQITTYGQLKRNSLLELYLNYNKELGINNFHLMGGYSWQRFHNQGFNAHHAFDRSLPGASYIPYANEYYLVSFFGRLEYALLDRYLLTFTLRDDGSSRFAENNRWGLFPSAALAWKLTDEPFIGKSDFLNELKLRLSWGKAGQQEVLDNYYPYIATYQASTAGAYYMLGDSAYSTLRPNPYDANIKWETLTSLNAGLDFTIMEQKISGSIDVYKNTSDDLINSIPIPVGSNFSNYLTTNVGSMVNKGVELSLNYTPILEQEFSWNIGFNLTYNKNEITKLTLSDDPNYPGVNTGDIAGGVGNTVQKYIVGYPYRVFFLFSQVYDANGKPIEGLYVDKSGQGGNVSGNELNKYYLKSPAPDVLMGISSRVNYKDFDLSFSGRLSLGNYVYNNNASNMALYQNVYNQSGYAANILTDVNRTNFATAQYWSSIYLENASFFKLDYVSLGYNFQSLLGNNIGGRIGFTVQNVFTITRYTGLDPEVENGIDNNIYPRSRTYMVSVSLNY